MRHFLCVLALALLPWSEAGSWKSGLGLSRRSRLPSRPTIPCWSRCRAAPGAYRHGFGLHNPDPKARFQRREILSSRAKGFAWRTAFTNSKGRRF